MVDRCDSGIGSGWRLLDLFKTGQDTAIVVPLDEAVHGVAVGRYRCSDDTYKAVFEFLRFLHDFAAAADRFVKSCSRVVHAQCDVANAIAMGRDVTRYCGGRIRCEWGGEKKLHLPSANEPRSSIADSGFQSGISERNETESSPIEMPSLPPVRYVKLYVIDALQFDKIRTHDIGGVTAM